jgi:LPXTG-motif cell wall-anchored protein
MLRILEIAWLCVAIATFGTALFQFFTGEESWWFLLIGTVIATAMYLVRRKQRMKMEDYSRKQQDTARYH